ncbi:hypothetical protein KN200_14040 [Clavibacter michiganensis subsp. michiganensis]|nr:hypothetical protein [Clavibacter michiganensis subsp. michiganensis]MWJ00160.1 hypothetical protein [Clavibacter michiganensis subsp. michiganensis]MWJ14639.1 hypothetical protein [Clavibacter michiganensis subsp. michiganensis]MWJ24283.1 hypothetical protein [Clavibacter michiganensis subsp. michiganensis]MWJ35911.1 hypothetical protein [Clavibacter michiganensis subsp. michiganensis]
MRTPAREVSSGPPCPRRAPASDRPRHPLTEDPPVLDLVYIAGAIVLFALVAVVGRGVEKL